MTYAYPVVAVQLDRRELREHGCDRVVVPVGGGGCRLDDAHNRDSDELGRVGECLVGGNGRRGSAAGLGGGAEWTVAAVISGTARQGQTLSSSTGTWTGTAPISYATQWWRCDSAGKNCANVGRGGVVVSVGGG